MFIKTISIVIYLSTCKKYQKRLYAIVYVQSTYTYLHWRKLCDMNWIIKMCIKEKKTIFHYTICTSYSEYYVLFHHGYHRRHYHHHRIFILQQKHGARGVLERICMCESKWEKSRSKSSTTSCTIEKIILNKKKMECT